jgi:hypothetical protein
LLIIISPLLHTLLRCFIFLTKQHIITSLGRTQAVSHRLQTATVRVRCQVTSCRIFGGQTGTVASILRVPQLPLPIYIPPNALYLLITLSSTLYSLNTDSVVKQPT